MQWKTATMVALATAAGGLLAGLLGTASALADLDVTAGLVIRGALGSALVFLLPLLIVRARVLTGSRGALLAAGTAGVLLGYALNPFAWAGRALAAQLVVEPGLPSGVLDLAAWLLLGALAVLVASRAAVPTGEPVGYRT